MSHQHKLTPTDMGMIGIYLEPSDTTAKRSRVFWFGQPLYGESVQEFVEQSSGEKVAPWPEQKCAIHVFAA